MKLYINCDYKIISLKHRLHSMLFNDTIIDFFISYIQIHL